MNSLLVSKISYALIIFMSSLLSGLLPLRNKNKNKPEPSSLNSKEFVIGEALAAGVFLGAGLLHMLNDAARDFITLGYKYPIAYFLTGVVFLALLLLDHIGRELTEHSGRNSVVFVGLSVIMLSIHSIFEGVALGIRTDVSLMMIVFIAIIAHKWAASYALAVQIKKSNLSSRVNWGLFLFFAIMTPAGIFLGNLINSGLESSDLIEPIFTSLAAGTFLYIGTLHGLNRAVMIERCCNLNDYMYVLLGFGLMALVGFIL